MTLSTEKADGPFENSKALEELMTQMIEMIPELQDCKNFNIGIMYTTKKLSHNGRPVAARCSKVSGSLRFKTTVDFVIVVNQNGFFASTREEQGATMIHELFHVKVSDKGKRGETLPAIRAHDGDFCELPEHDRYPRDLWEKYGKGINAVKKIPLQERLEA